MSIPLPPKYFQDPNDSRYDPIRHFPWFSYVNSRWSIAELANRALILADSEKISVPSAALMLGVKKGTVHSLRLWKNKTPWASYYTDFQIYKDCLDDAYVNYCENFGGISFRKVLFTLVPHYRVNKNLIDRMWEFEYFFYPTGYEAPK